MSSARSAHSTDDLDRSRRLRRALAAAWIGVALLIFGLTGCEDDPILSPGNVEDTGTGGSYGRLSVPEETGRETGTPPRTGGAEKIENPERF